MAKNKKSEYGNKNKKRIHQGSDRVPGGTTFFFTCSKLLHSKTS